MGSNDKFCKVTVHRASPSSSTAASKPVAVMPPLHPRGRRQTIGTEFESNLFFQRGPPPPAAATNTNAGAAAVPYTRATERYNKSSAFSEIIPDEEFDAMLQTAEQSRRRAKTDATTASSRGGIDSIRKSRKMNPLSRLTQRWTEQRESAKESGASPFFADDEDDDVTSNTVDLLDDEDDDDDDEPPLLDIRACGEFNHSFLDCDTNESDPLRQTIDDTFAAAAGTPPIPAGLTLDMLPTANTDPNLSRSFARDLFASYGPSQSTPTANTTTDDDTDDEFNTADDDDPFVSLAQLHGHYHYQQHLFDTDASDDDVSSVATSSHFESGDDNSDDDEVNIDDVRAKADAIARFEASFGHDGPTPLFRTTEQLPRTRMQRGMSSPVRMLSQVIRTRKQSNPVQPQHPYPTTSQSSSASDDLRVARSALYSGQTLHLNFKTSRSQVVQVSGQPKASASKNLFSKRIRCQTVDATLPLALRDALRIIGHTTDGIIHGGDCISIARNDGHVLRLQTLSKKLCFSPKIDLRAKFIVSGVPHGTVVTHVTKFYLQSVYDRSKTVGFLHSRRKSSSSPGCLVMYVYRSKDDDKSEPIQFYQRGTNETSTMAMRHYDVEPRAAVASRQQRAQQQQLAAADLTPIDPVF